MGTTGETTGLGGVRSPAWHLETGAATRHYNAPHG